MTCELHAFSNDKCPACFRRDPTPADIERMLADHSVLSRIGTHYTTKRDVEVAAGSGDCLVKALARAKAIR